MEVKTTEYQTNRLEFVKDPVIAEFLGVPQDKDYLESDPEEAIITNLQKVSNGAREGICVRGARK